MSLDELRDRLPDYAKDIRLNLGSLASETSLTDQQKYGAFLASALASRNATVIRAIAAWTEDKLSPEAATAAKAAAAIMGMNNVYYRATHLMAAKDYAKMPARLRMNVIGNPGVDKVDFELWSLAVSAINGCGMCLDAHEQVVRKAGLTTEQVQAAIRIAAAVHAAAAVLDGEEALAA
ncbi:carboxymuconolactone decarboxylase family protein [Amphiplicatus metriothermophilus]|uniref:Alkyl hydroperoxide reductase AhpD n=1 Tax=Amphiplicatus metriothermophilus TaxID=1519374 RepID=A0A239PM34_9PROT|nr:carboxymuconolactone decarboxylase family protein [Amphiplicatus metriothermophilus]MBB5517241.1 alkyl hydroperoxide reductase subunit D [Amphiplicatus metriothermophilus]SNT68423.1 alkyl hydroperoxide reductase subunit D [Amphiplicatus metriothermophilus]